MPYMSIPPSYMPYVSNELSIPVGHIELTEISTYILQKGVYKVIHGSIVHIAPSQK